MAINYTHTDVIAAAEAAHMAIKRYSQQHHVCAGCLTGHVVTDMLRGRHETEFNAP